jgi:hypothetical protein
LSIWYAITVPPRRVDPADAEVFLEPNSTQDLAPADVLAHYEQKTRAAGGEEVVTVMGPPGHRRKDKVLRDE